MNLICNDTLDLQAFCDSIATPALFEKGTARFWDDAHVSRQMLKFHLDPHGKLASRQQKTIEAEAAFIAQSTGMKTGKTVLDLGCGPGLYVKEFAKTGAHIVGIDLSENSIRHARETVQPHFENTAFFRMNYLDMDFKEQFDIVTLIFYDFCALNTDEQHELLSLIHRALKPGGRFMFDVITEHREIPEGTDIAVYDGGLWSPDAYIEIRKRHLYPSPKTEGIQYTIIQEDGTIRIIRIYHRLFALEEIKNMLHSHGLEVSNVYADLAGRPLVAKPESFGILAVKA